MVLKWYYVGSHPKIKGKFEKKFENNFLFEIVDIIYFGWEKCILPQS